MHPLLSDAAVAAVGVVGAATVTATGTVLGVWLTRRSSNEDAQPGDSRRVRKLRRQLRRCRLERIRLEQKLAECERDHA